MVRHKFEKRKHISFGFQKEVSNNNNNNRLVTNVFCKHMPNKYIFADV